MKINLNDLQALITDTDMESRYEGISLLLQHYPDVLVTATNHEWVRLAEDSLRNLQLPRSTKDPLLVEYSLSESMIYKRMFSFPATREKRQRRRYDPRRQVETYMILMLALYFDNKLDPTPDFIQSATTFVRKVNNSHLSLKCYQILSLLYTDMGNPTAAHNFGSVAYYAFHHQKNQLEVALSAHNLAIAYHQLSDLSQSRHFLKIAHSYYQENDYGLQLQATNDLFDRLGNAD